MFCQANGQKIIYKWKQQALCDIYVRRADFAADIAMLYGGKVERQVAREVARGLSPLAILMTRINLTHHSLTK